MNEQAMKPFESVPEHPRNVNILETNYILILFTSPPSPTSNLPSTCLAFVAASPPAGAACCKPIPGRATSSCPPGSTLSLSGLFIPLPPTPTFRSSRSAITATIPPNTNMRLLGILIRVSGSSIGLVGSLLVIVANYSLILINWFSWFTGVFEWGCCVKRYLHLGDFKLMSSSFERTLAKDEC
ncbi:hypothetical protein NMY22_g12978 [Coprinellus aureogranulatus]|nr:hypothetical protein NMY22_g12978 [Coprinellus aureogranulatus]